MTGSTAAATVVAHEYTRRHARVNAIALQEIEGIPAGLLELPAERLHERLGGGMALIHAPGSRSPPLFVSVLLRGDEVNGWDALRRLLARARPPLPRALSFLIGDTEAARAGVRALPGRPDYDRIWGGGETPGRSLAQRVLDSMQRRGVYAAIDVHDRGEAIPPHAVVTETAASVLGLARSFGPLAILCASSATLTRRFSVLAPAVRIECGDARDPHGATRAMHFLERRLSEESLPSAEPNALQLFACEARVTIAAGAEFSFNGTAALQLRGDLVQSNFKRLSGGTLFARQRRGPLALAVRDAAGTDVTGQYLALERDEVRLACALYPARYTTDPVVAREECLSYFMNPYRGSPPKR